MQYRILGKTGFRVSKVALGCWQLGGTWGSGFDERLASKLLHKAVDKGINFFDTADVYENQKSEAAVGRFIKKIDKKLFVATKCGRSLNPHVDESYTPKVMRRLVERNLKNLGVDCLDLIQLHCPPPAVYYRPEIFGEFEILKAEGKIHNLGVSVEKVEEGLKAISYDNVTTIQIIHNMFRLRPTELFFKEAASKNVGIIVRVPLASGMLSGKFGKNSKFGKGDHRQFNRDGAGFDKGETFSGVPYAVALKAVEEIRKQFPRVKNLAPYAIKWILMHPEVSTVIPGASKPSQIPSNVSSVEIPDFTKEQLSAIRSTYDSLIKPHVHHLW